MTKFLDYVVLSLRKEFPLVVQELDVNARLMFRGYHTP